MEALQSWNKMVMCTVKYVKMKEDEDERKAKREEERRDKEAHPPLGATVPGGEEEYPQDPEYLYAG